MNGQQTRSRWVLCALGAAFVWVGPSCRSTPPTPPSPREHAVETGKTASTTPTGAPGQRDQPTPTDRPDTDPESTGDLEDWQLARATDTVSSYAKYLSSHPQGRYAGPARGRMEAGSFESAAAVNTETSLEKFLERYPQGRFAQDAADRLEQLRYDQARAEDDIPRYEHFLARHPSGRFSKAIRFRLQQLHYRRVIEHGSEADIENFLVRYPTGPYHQDLRARLSKLQYEAACKIDRDEAYLEFLLNHPTSKEAPGAVAQLRGHTFRHVRSPWKVPWAKLKGARPDMVMLTGDYPISLRPSAFTPPPTVEPGKPYIQMADGIYLRQGTVLYFDVLTTLGRYRFRGSARVTKEALVFLPGSDLIRKAD